MWPSFTFHFSTRILDSTHMTVFNILFAKCMSRCPTINFQFSIMSKWLSKHISTKVSFKITTRKKTCFNWDWLTLNMKPLFKFGNLNAYLTEMRVLPSFQLATRLNSQNTNEKEFINELWHINLYMNIGISI